MDTLAAASGRQGRAERDAVIAAQQATIAELEARVERLMASNSRNSSFPPSMDGQPGRKRPAPRRQRGDGTRGRGK